MRKISLLDNKREFMTGCRMFFLCLVFLLTGMLLGCNTDDESGDDEDNTPVGVWTLISVSYYEYNSDDQLIRETDYNNTGNTRDSSDMTWYYEYDSDGLKTGYYMYEGFVGLNPDPNVDADGVGTYFYNTNDCNNRLDRADIVSLSVNIAKEMLEEIDEAVEGGRND